MQGGARPRRSYPPRLSLSSLAKTGGGRRMAKSSRPQPQAACAGTRARTASGGECAWDGTQKFRFVPHPPPKSPAQRAVGHGSRATCSKSCLHNKCSNFSILAHYAKKNYEDTTYAMGRSFVRLSLPQGRGSCAAPLARQRSGRVSPGTPLARLPRLYDRRVVPLLLLVRKETTKRASHGAHEEGVLEMMALPTASCVSPSGGGRPLLGCLLPPLPPLLPSTHRPPPFLPTAHRPPSTAHRPPPTAHSHRHGCLPACAPFALVGGRGRRGGGVAATSPPPPGGGGDVAPPPAR